jgi:hypothetical protein
MAFFKVDGAKKTGALPAKPVNGRIHALAGTAKNRTAADAAPAGIHLDLGGNGSDDRDSEFERF